MKYFSTIVLLLCLNYIYSQNIYNQNISPTASTFIDNEISVFYILGNIFLEKEINSEIIIQDGIIGELSEISVSPIKDDLSNKIKIIVYPVPSNSNVTIEVLENITNLYHYQILSVDGKTIKNGILSKKNSEHINISDLPSTLYFLHINDEYGVNKAIFKIIKN